MTRDQELAEYYDDPSNREPSGPPVRQSRPGRMTEHIAIRFPSSTTAKVKTLADDAGQTVSGWIRSVVDREIQRLLPDAPVTSAEQGWIRTIDGRERPNVVIYRHVGTETSTEIHRVG